MSGENTIILLEIAEPEDAFAPKDTQGNLAPLETGEDANRPTVTQALTGYGRSFDGASGFQAADADDGDTLLTRDATIQVLLTISDLDEAWPRVVYVRGTGDVPSGATEYHSLGLEFDLVDGETNLVDVRLFWMNSAGTLKRQDGATFRVDSETAEYMITATRRWDASDSVTCRYYVNDQLIGENLSGDGDIAGATTATTCIGYMFVGPTDFWWGTIDQLKLLDYEMPGSEVEATWLRLTKYQDLGVHLFNTRVPPGSNWAKPGTYWAKLGRIAGAMLGYAMAKVEELRENFLPARAYSDTLRRWERVRKIAPKHREPLDDRRARVMAVSGRTNGYALENVQEVLAEPLAVAAADIEILEPTNIIEDGFDVDPLDEECWYVDVCDPANMAWATTGGELEGTVSGAADGCQWDSAIHQPCRVMTSLASGEGELIVEGKLASNGDHADGVIAAMLLHNVRSADSLWFGVKNEGGTRKVGYTRYLGGVLSAFVALEDPAPAFPIWFRIRRDEDVPATFRLQWSTDGDTYDSEDVTLADFEPEWFGFAFHATGALAGDVSAKWDNAKVITPEGDRPFHWFAYRDPADPGVAELNLANAVARRVTPSHAHGAAITSKSVICDDPINGLCDRGPMGWPG